MYIYTVRPCKGDEAGGGGERVDEIEGRGKGSVRSVAGSFVRALGGKGGQVSKEIGNGNTHSLTTRQ